MDSLIRDVRVGWRGLLRRPGFTLAAVVTLALAIGGNTAIFSVVHGMLIEPLPYPDADRLTFLWSDLPVSNYQRAPIAGAELGDLRERSKTHEAFGAVWASSATLIEDARPQPLRVAMVTANFLSILGREPALGRWFEDGDEGDGVPPRIVISGALFASRFGGDPSLLGRAVRIDGGWGVPGGLFTVVGVMPADFEMLLPLDSSVPRTVDVWMPFQDDIVPNREDYYLRTIGRLAPGATLEQARDEIAAIARAVVAEHSEYAATGRTFYPVSLHQDGVRGMRPALLALLGGTAFVLLIACANVASLLLARSAERHREISIRAALGAGRRRIARQLVTESVLLASAGGLLGLALAYLALDLLRTLQPAGLRFDAIALSAPVLGFSCAVTLLCGLIFGLAPMWDSWRLDIERALRSDARGGDRGRTRAHGVLVVAEVALAIVLLSGAGLMIHSFVRLQEVDAGFRGEGVLTFQLSMPRARYAGPLDLANFTRELEGRLRGLPGVTAAGAINQLPLSDLPNWSTPWQVRGAENSDEAHEADARIVTPGYLDAVGARLVAGRGFEPSDDENSRHVVLVDELLAREAWPSQPAVGQEMQVTLWGGPGRGFVPVWAEVVGVVHHVRHHDLTQQVRGQMFAPFAQGPRSQVAVAVRGEGDPLALVGPAREAIAAIDPELALANVQPLERYVDHARAGARFRMVLAGLLGALALVLACVGLYGVLSFSVVLRRREIGVRMALGGTPAGMIGMIVGRGMGLLAVGAALGLLAASFVNRLLEGLLFEVSPTDPTTLVSILAVLTSVSLLACWLPARRAGGVDPVRSLRCD